MSIADELLQSQSFFVEFEQTQLRGDIVSLSPDETYTPPAVLFLHGGEEGDDRGVFNTLREVLLNQHGVSSCSFDFVGHGETGGDWQKTTRQVRIQQTLEVVDACFDCQSFSIVGVGIGADTALKVLSDTDCPVSNVVLMSPSLHSPELDAATLSFHGNLAIINATQDQRALAETVMPVDANTRVAREYKFIDMPADSHGIMAFANSRPDVLSDLAQTIADTCLVTVADT